MPPKPPAKPVKTVDIDIERIQKILPHRYPFLLVDRILELRSGQSITALKNVTYNEPFFQGHFPGRKIMPGVLQIEAMAQAGGVLLYHSLDDPETKIVLLSKVNYAKFRKPVIPGDQLIFRAELRKRKSRFLTLEGRGEVDGEVVMEAALLASVMEYEEL